MHSLLAKLFSVNHINLIRKAEKRCKSKFFTGTWLRFMVLICL